MQIADILFKKNTHEKKLEEAVSKHTKAVDELRTEIKQVGEKAIKNFLGRRKVRHVESKRIIH